MKLIILGEPTSKQSTRIGKDKAGNARAFKDPKVKRAEENIKCQIITQLPKDFKPFSGPIMVESIIYVFAPLKSFSKKKQKAIDNNEIVYKTTKPDLPDNLNKVLFDAMEGIVFINDSQVCHIKEMMKIYGNQPRTEIVLKEIS